MRTILLIATALMLAATPALAEKTREEATHWTLGTDDLGSYAQGENVFVRYATTRAGDTLVLGGLSAAGHGVLDALYVPGAIGPPDARGAKLEFIGVDDPNLRLALFDNEAAVTDVACGAGGPELPPNPCVAVFEEGHALRIVQSNARSSVIEVTMEADDGSIIPCVRVVVQGPVAIEGTSLSFSGDLHLNALGIDDPNI